MSGNGVTKFRVNGVELAVRDQGSGDPALIFLHYWGGSSRTWREVVRLLSPTYRCVAYDHRGWGDSEAPKTQAAGTGYSIAELAADAMALIRELRIERFVLVGHSMGGKAAQFLAGQRPEGLAGLVLVAPAPPTPQEIPEEAKQAQFHAYDNRQTVLQAIQFLTAHGLSEELTEQVVEDSLRGSAGAKLAWPTSSAYEDISAEAARIAVPTLILAGDTDRQDPLEQQRREVEGRIPGAELRVIHDSGHLSPLEQPGQLAGAIAQFLSGV